MSEITKRFVLLFIGQLPAFHVVYALLPGYGIWIIILLIVWVLAWMTWFTIANQHVKKKWLYLPLALIIAIAGQLLSWITFLIRLIHG